MFLLIPDPPLSCLLLLAKSPNFFRTSFITCKNGNYTTYFTELLQKETMFLRCQTTRGAHMRCSISVCSSLRLTPLSGQLVPTLQLPSIQMGSRTQILRSDQLHRPHIYVKDIHSRWGFLHQVTGDTYQIGGAGVRTKALWTYGMKGSE